MAEVDSSAGTSPIVRAIHPTHVSEPHLLGTVFFPLDPRQHPAAAGPVSCSSSQPGCALLMGSVTLKPDSRLNSTGQQEALRPKDPPEPLLCLPGLQGVGS